MATNSEQAQNIEELRSRYDALNTKRITAEANLTTSRQNLENLKKQAREKYDTDDLVVLREKLQEMTRDNERKRAEYQEHLTSIENEIAEVDAQHSNTSETEAHE